MIDFSILSNQYIWYWIIISLFIIMIGAYMDDMTISVIPVTAISIYLSFNGYIFGWIWILVVTGVSIFFSFLFVQKLIKGGRAT